MLLDAIPQNKIALRTRLANLLKAKPYNHETFMRALNEYTPAHVNLVLGDLLADMERGAWRDTFRGALDPSGGTEAFYKDFPQDALLALLNKATRRVAIDALKMPLRGWPYSVIERLVCYRTADQTTALVNAFAQSINETICKEFLEHITYLGTDGPKKWLILFNKVPSERAHQIIQGHYESTEAGTREYESPLSRFLSSIEFNVEELYPYLDLSHVSVMYGFAAQDYNERPNDALHGFMRTTLEKTETTFKHRGFGSLTLLYKPTDSVEAFAELVTSAVSAPNKNCWAHRHQVHENHQHKADFERLLKTMVIKLAPATHWEWVLRGIPETARFALVEPLIHQAAGFAFFPKYTPGEFFDVLKAWAGNDNHLALKIMCIVAMRLSPSDTSEYAQLQRNLNNFDQIHDTTVVTDLFEAFEQISGWEGFVQKLQDAYPDITTTTRTLALFSKNANEVTGNGATLEGGVKLGEFAAMKSNNGTSNNTPKVFELRAFSEMKNKK